MTAIDLTTVRRELHRIPEVGLHLPLTQSVVLDSLAGLGLEITTGSALSSVTAVLRGTGGLGASAKPRPTVLLRSDMDALPVIEETGLPFAADSGAMHACGHDLHMAMLLASARSLAERRDELHGDVIFAFQPGEEGHGGAKLMLAEGVLGAAGGAIRAALGMHVLSYLVPRNRIGVRHGPIMSGSTLVRVTFRGRGGHGSAPHLTNDPLLAGAMFVPTVTVAVSRGTDMFDPHTLTFGAFRGGESFNVIPHHVELLGTLRAFSPHVVERAQWIIRAVANSVAAAHEVDVDVELIEDSVPTTSTDREVDIVAATAGDDAALWMDRPISVSEDFSWFLRDVPGAFVLLGAQVPTADGDRPHANHSARAQFDEDVMALGHRLEVDWAIHRLAQVD